MEASISVKIYIERSQELANAGQYDDAYSLLNIAEQHAFRNNALLDDIRDHREAIAEAHRRKIAALEVEAINIFQADQFDTQKARKILQALQEVDKNNELARSLWHELPAKETAERERHLARDFQRELERIWEKAHEFEDIGEGMRAITEYESALVKASKKVDDVPSSIPFLRLKREAAKKRNQAKERWVDTPALILNKKGQELIKRYLTLKRKGVTETEFFDENAEFLSKLPIDVCIKRAKEMADHFTSLKAQDYLEQTQELKEKIEPVEQLLHIVNKDEGLRGRQQKHLKDLLRIHLENLQELEKKKALYGEIDVPIYILNAIKGEKLEIEQIRQKLENP